MEELPDIPNVPQGVKDFGAKLGQEASQRAITRYKNREEGFRPDFAGPMAYASGFTTAFLLRGLAKRWVVPLQRRLRVAIFAAIVSLGLLSISFFYLWSAVSAASFRTFAVGFIPGIAALVLSLAKSYKTWCEGRKHLAEAGKLDAETKHLSQKD